MKDMYCEKCEKLIDPNEDYFECPECERLLCDECSGICINGHCEDCENHL